MTLSCLFLSVLFLWSFVAAFPLYPRVLDWEKYQLLESHNEARMANGANPLSWSDDLASAAQSWVSLCDLKHFDGDISVGENLVAGTFSTLSKAVDVFTSDKDQYDHAHPTSLHWTQVVWKETTQLGCGVAICPNLIKGKEHTKLVGCLYNPIGNVIERIAKNV